MLEVERKFDEDKAIELLKEICNGFLSLVREGIVHRYGNLSYLEILNLLISCFRKAMRKLEILDLPKRNTNHSKFKALLEHLCIWPHKFSSQNHILQNVIYGHSALSFMRCFTDVHHGLLALNGS